MGFCVYTKYPMKILLPHRSEWLWGHNNRVHMYLWQGTSNIGTNHIHIQYSRYQTDLSAFCVYGIRIPSRVRHSHLPLQVMSLTEAKYPMKGFNIITIQILSSWLWDSCVAQTPFSRGPICQEDKFMMGIGSIMHRICLREMDFFHKLL